MAFHLGSLGFLTSFRFQDFREKVTGVLEGTISGFEAINSSCGKRSWEILNMQKVDQCNMQIELIFSFAILLWTIQMGS